MRARVLMVTSAVLAEGEQGSIHMVGVQTETTLVQHILAQGVPQ